MDEVVLSGGNMTPVARVGDTVRRAAGPWTPTIHALLRHIRASGVELAPEPLGLAARGGAGFEPAPEPLGLDERGREIVSFRPGLVPTYPLPGFVLSDGTLTTA